MGRLRPFRNRFDLEHDQWEELRPDAFHPLNSLEGIRRHIDIECEIYSAMPGAEEAFLLAQRIGIGRFVPCFILFSDVGSPTVCVLPMAGRSPDAVFNRLRRWIDSFYEINNPTLKYWAKIEESIEKLSSQVRSSVYAVSRWRDERLGEWKDLQRLAFYQRRLGSATPSVALLEEIEADRDLSLNIRMSIRAFRDQWRSLEQKIADAQGALKWIEKLKSIKDPRVAQLELVEFKAKQGSRLPESLRRAITATDKVLTFPPSPLSPSRSVVEWWQSEHGRPFSRNRYNKYRGGWVAYSKAKYGASAIGRAAEICSEEFAVVRDAAMARRVSCDPALAANEVLLALAQHLAVSPEDPSWLSSVSHYREVLIDYFYRLNYYIPAWIPQLGGDLIPPLTWEDCIPPIEVLQKCQRDQCIQFLPRLSIIAERAFREWDASAGAEERRRLERQHNALAEIYSEIEAWCSAGKQLENDKISIWLAVASSVSEIRTNLEDRIFSVVKESGAVSFPSRVVCRDDAMKLLNLLDDYERAVKSLVLPFERDSEVLRLSLDISLNRLTRSVLEPEISPDARAKDDLLKAAADAEEAMRRWGSVKSEAIDYSPAGKLCCVLWSTLSPSRLEELRPSLGSVDPQEAVVALSDRQMIIQILEELSLQELLLVENKITLDGSSILSDPATKVEVFSSILMAIGLTADVGSTADDRCKVDLLKEKAIKGQFDVFLAHNSEDRAAVLRLGNRLRSRGIYPWIDVEQVPPGQWFQDVLQSAIRTVRAAAIIFGATGVGKWQAVEMRAFISRCVQNGKPVIPVLLPGTDSIPDEFVFLRELSQVRFEKDVTEDAGIADLIWGITGEKSGIAGS